MNLPTLPLPECAVCGRPVERMTQDLDILRDEMILTAHCHGQRERVRIESELPAEFGSPKVGRAFASAGQLPPAPRALPAP